MPLTLGILEAGGGNIIGPRIMATTTTSFASATSHVVNLPTGIQAGDLLVVITSTFTSSNDTTVTVPTGWSPRLAGVQSITGFPARYIRCGTTTKIATGTEGATMTLTTGIAAASISRAYRITNNRPTNTSGATGDWAVYAAALTSTATPDLTAITNPYPTGQHLYIPTLTWLSTGTTVTGYPSGFIMNNEQSTTTGLAMATAANEMANLASVDVPPWQLSASVSHALLTLVIIRQK